MRKKKITGTYCETAGAPGLKRRVVATKLVGRGRGRKTVLLIACPCGGKDKKAECGCATRIYKKLRPVAKGRRCRPGEKRITKR